jgi:hypothetical protein
MSDQPVSGDIDRINQASQSKRSFVTSVVPEDVGVLLRVRCRLSGTASEKLCRSHHPSQMDYCDLTLN